MKAKILVGACVVVALALVGCSSSSDDTGSTSGSSGSTSGSSGGTTGKPYTGSVILTVGAGSLPATAYASFIASAEGTTGGGSTCPGGTQQGACCFIPAPAATTGTTGTTGAAPSTFSAGTITVSKGSDALATLEVTDGGSSYGSATLPTPWTDGDVLSIAATGDTVHAFSGDLTTVEVMSGLTPDFSVNPVAVPIASDLVFTWTAGSSAGAQVSLSLNGSAGDHLSCSAADSAGTLSVPSALLAKFSAGSGGSVSIGRVAHTTLSADNADVNVTEIGAYSAQFVAFQ